MNSEAIALENLTKRFGAVTAVDGASLTIGRGEFFSLLGPSGCGKTTLLRLIAGLEQPDSGQLSIEGVPMTGVPAQKRPVNTVFQNYALFPHLNVFDNVAFGLRMKREPNREIQKRVESALDLVHVSELRLRLPSQISGGQKQRVALARALVNEPKVLLLDEPLAAVDAKLRWQLQTDLKALQRNLGTTFIYVTHDQDEALGMSDRLAVLERGRIAQLGTPEEVYESPRSRFVASFLGACNVFEGRIVQRNEATARISTAAGALEISTRPKLPADRVTVGVRREHIRLVDQASADNCLRGEIVTVTYTGVQTEFAVKVNDLTLTGWYPNTAGSRRVVPGDVVNVHIAPNAILLLEDE